MMNQFRKTKNEKGQGLTEFVLVLAFCAIIGWAASKVGFLDAISAAFDVSKKPEYITAAIGGGGSSVTPTPTPTPDPDPDPNPNPNPNPNPDTTYNEFDWGRIDPHLYYKKAYKDEHASRDGGISFIDFSEEEARQDRLITDQQALANLASHFIGLTQKQVSDMMKTGQTGDMGKDSAGDNIVLGHIIPPSKNETRWMQLSTNKGDDRLKPEYKDEVLKWMKNPTDPDSVEIEDNYMYLVSDYVVSQGWTASSGSNQGCGIHLRLEYDYSGQFGTYNSVEDVEVVGVHVVVFGGFKPCHLGQRWLAVNVVQQLHGHSSAVKERYCTWLGGCHGLQVAATQEAIIEVSCVARIVATLADAGRCVAIDYGMRCWEGVRVCTCQGCLETDNTFFGQALQAVCGKACQPGMVRQVERIAKKEDDG